MKNFSYKTVFIVFFVVSLIGIGVSTDLTNIESIFPQDEDINVEGNLDMNNNDIRSFFSSSCSGGEVMVAVEDDGSYDCVDVSDEVSGDYVSIDGDAMEGSLDMRGNNIQDVGDIDGSTWGSLDISQSDVDPSDVGLSDLTTGSGLSGSSYDGTSGESWSVSWGSANDLDSGGTISSGSVGGDELESSFESGSEYDGRFVSRDGDSVSGELSLEDGLSLEGSTEHSYNGIRSTTSNSGHLMIDSNDGNAYINWEDDGDVYLAGGGGDVDLMDGDGSVGVGTRSPSYQLDVQGDARFTDDVNMDGNDIEDVSRMNVEDGFQVPVGEDAW